MALDKEILDDFRAESKGLLGELEEVVESLEESTGFPEAELKEFSQKIDRIMGAAKTLQTMDEAHPGLAFLAKASELCKTIGYQAAALKRAALVPIFAGFWADTLETMGEVLSALDSPEKTKELTEKKSAHLQKRLAWLAERVAPESEEEKQKVMALLKKL